MRVHAFLDNTSIIILTDIYVLSTIQVNCCNSERVSILELSTLQFTEMFMFHFFSV
jgi:hypothetical protein